MINHGKHEFWGKPGVHYHQVKGDQTDALEMWTSLGGFPKKFHWPQTALPPPPHGTQTVRSALSFSKPRLTPSVLNAQLPSCTHPHPQGMKAGENTLNALCARLVVRDVAGRSAYDPK